MNTFKHKLKRTWEHWTIGTLCLFIGLASCIPLPVPETTPDEYVEVKGHLDAQILFREMGRKRYRHLEMYFTVYEYPYHVFVSDNDALSVSVWHAVQAGKFSFKPGVYNDSIKFTVPKKALEKMRITKLHEFRNPYFSGREIIQRFSDYTTEYLKPDTEEVDQKSSDSRPALRVLAFGLGTILLLGGTMKWRKLDKKAGFPM